MKLSEEDFEAIEARMREHIKADEHFEREDLPVADAVERFRGEGQDYKVELIEDLVKNPIPGPGETVSLYTQRALHRPLPRARTVPGTKRIKAVQAHQRRRRVLAGRRGPPDAHARVRDRLGI